EGPPLRGPAGVAYDQRRPGRRISAEAEHEPAVGGYAQLPAVQPHGAARRYLAAHEAALHQITLQVQLGCLRAEQRAKAAQEDRSDAQQSHAPSPEPAAHVPAFRLSDG